MAFPAVLTGVHGIHGHLSFGLLHSKSLRMTIAACKHLRMKLMAESHISETARFIGDILFKDLHLLHLVAQRTFRRRKGLLAVMACATISALIN